MQLVLGHVVDHRLHPIGHHVVPDFRGDNFVGHQAKKSVQAVFQVRGSRSESFPGEEKCFQILGWYSEIGEREIPMSSHSDVIRRMGQQARDENVVMRLHDLRQPSTHVLGFQLF